jgi:hypothetical protein
MPVKNSINNQSTGFTVNAPTSGTALTVTAAAGSLAATFTGSNVGGISVAQANGGASSYQAVQSSVDVQPVYFNAFKNRAGGIIVANDVIYQLGAFGFADTNRQAGLYRIFSTNVGANFVSGGHDWWTTSTAGTTAQRMILGADGQVTINGPAAALTTLIVGAFSATGNYAAEFFGNASGALFDGIRVLNNATTAGSSSQIECSVSSQALVTGGDPYLRFVNYGFNAVSIGLDTSTQQLAMTSGSGVGGAGNFFTWTVANNQINLPLQACFFAILATNDVDVTGNGAAYTLGTNVAWTEIFDQGNNFNTNGTFTAPATGRYHFSASIRFFEADTATSFQTRFNTSNRLIVGDQKTYAITASFQTTAANVICDMDSGDTCTLQLQINGLAGNTADLSGDSPTAVTYFSGTLVA